MNLAEGSPVGWCALGIFAFLILAVNLWLFSLLRNRRQSGGARPAAPSPLSQTLHTLRDPFAAENERLKELAQKVDQLKKHQGE